MLAACCFECFVKSDRAFRNPVIEAKGKEDLRGNPPKHEAGMVLKPKLSVEIRVPYNATPFSAKAIEPRQSFPNESCANALPMIRG